MNNYYKIDSKNKTLLLQRMSLLYQKQIEIEALNSVIQLIKNDVLKQNNIENKNIKWDDDYSGFIIEDEKKENDNGEMHE